MHQLIKAPITDAEAKAILDAAYPPGDNSAQGFYIRHMWEGKLNRTQIGVEYDKISSPHCPYSHCQNPHQARLKSYGKTAVKMGLLVRQELTEEFCASETARLVEEHEKRPA